MTAAARGLKKHSSLSSLPSRALADLLARYVRSIPETGSGSRKQRADGKTRARLLKLIEDLNWYSSHANIEDERGEQRSSAASDRYASEVARCEREAANDISTAEFMKEMYSQIRAGASKRAALRAAQLAVKDAYGHPYYWAPFILMGNPNLSCQ